MQNHEMRNHAKTSQLSHFNFLFSGWGSHVYDLTMVRLTRRLYKHVVKDIALLQLTGGKVLDAGTGPGTLARDIARSQTQLELYGIDLSEGMIQLARQHAKSEQIAERVHFDIGDIAYLPYPDCSFDLIVSTISMHHWHELEQPLRDLYRVLRPGGQLWIYDFRAVKTQKVETARILTPFAGTPLEHNLIRTGFLPFAFYQRFSFRRVQ